MFHVIYVSTATEPHSSSQLRDLLVVSRQRNDHLNLTGLLLYAHERFMQVLEGPEPAVREVFKSIQRDAMHKNVYTLRFEVKEKRHFPDWRMGFRDLSLATVASPAISRFLEASYDTSVFEDESSEPYRMLLAFRDANDR